MYQQTSSSLRLTQPFNAKGQSRNVSSEYVLSVTADALKAAGCSSHVIVVFLSRESPSQTRHLQCHKDPALLDVVIHVLDVLSRVVLLLNC